MVETATKNYEIDEKYVFVYVLIRVEIDDAYMIKKGWNCPEKSSQDFWCIMKMPC